MSKIFKDRTEAGKLLGQEILNKGIIKNNNVVVIGLPRGGVPVAFEVAKILNAPLDILLVRKIGFPKNKELALGAIAEDGTIFIDKDLVYLYSIPNHVIQEIMDSEVNVIQKRKKIYRDVCPQKDVNSKIVILVDDGIATGSSMLVAINAIRKKGPKKIIMALPVAPPSTFKYFKKHLDGIIILQIPSMFYAVGMWYKDFSQVEDNEVCRYLSMQTHFEDQ